MRTVVYQSFRTSGVPWWLGRCLNSVRAWAGGLGYDYRFVDDRLFDRVPAWYRERVGGQLCPMADLARLEVARELLAAGYGRTVWVDADVLVFRPEGLALPGGGGYAFCRELWLEPDGLGGAAFARKVNNAVAVFTAASAGPLAFFVDAALSLVRHRPGPVGKLDVSTNFLTALHAQLHFPLVGGVGLFGPAVLPDLAAGGGPLAEAYRAAFGGPLAAANLCASFRGQRVHGVEATDELFGRAVDTLLATRGAALNGPAPG